MNLYSSRNHRGFTLFELMISMTMFGLIMISIFSSVANIGLTRIKSTQRIGLLEELYFFSEKFANMIKEGGTIDYEEYWARKVRGTGSTGGHYTTATLFGNYGYNGNPQSNPTNDWGSGSYYCRSNAGSTGMGTGGCLTTHHTGGESIDYTGSYQRFGQYRLQFTDYNGNKNNDAGITGDEDGNIDIRGDEDDFEIGDGPEVIENPMLELYLIDMLKKKRTFFRLTYRADPDMPASGTACNINTGVGDCIGNIEVLKMDGKDIGKNHNGNTLSSNEAFDGKIDTWVCAEGWGCTGTGLGTYGTVSFGTGSDWIGLFPDYINVKNLRFDIYPKKNPWYSWKSEDNTSTPGFVSPFIHPYVKIELTLGFAWKRRTIIKNDDPTITLSTTLNLEDYTQ